ncbi:glycosyltransferase family 2 protein [Naasia lichenicola]|uniref:Glycosyltransferase family 2 protein n=1 Tax=Naasia lichenicola TaxID=2565933 RepID=A0A4S4FP43_9MICO|nr:glycosyltransferase family 2 protein [Naasia lichenicola]THG32011.1 glycosyltransferase family 2 protein [Naasia lichenicola]
MTDVSGIDVVITHYRSLDDLRENLHALRKLGSAHVRSVVVSDSAATGEARSIVRDEYPTATYIPFTHNVGYARLVNAGILSTSSPYVLVLNADVSLAPGGIEGLVGALDSDPGLGVVGPQVSNEDGSRQETAFSFYRPLTFLARRTRFGTTRLGRMELDRFTNAARVASSISSQSRMDVDWVMGCAFAIRRSALVSVGLMDTRFFMYFEDVDLCLRMWRDGWRVSYEPNARALHSWGRASKGGFAALLINPMARRHVASAVRFYRKHGWTGGTRHAI